MALVLSIIESQSSFTSVHQLLPVLLCFGGVGVVLNYWYY